MTQLLLVGSTVALVLLIVHSWRTRGRFVTLAFFISATLFGILRGNAIWLLCQYLSEGASEDLKPYVPQEGIIPQIGHESLQVALGWVFALYLAWTVSELILRRIERRKGDSPPNSVKGTVPFSSRVFMIAGLASVFMLAICWCMETTAVAVGWWYWTLPTTTTLFGNVNVPAMEAWFSVVPDFLIPFLVITCSTARRKWMTWLWVLAFPLHMLGHLAYRWFSYAYLVYGMLEVLVVVPMMFAPLRMARGEIAEREGDRLSGVLFAAALTIFFGVLIVANLAGGPDAAKVMTVLPMLMLCLLAWRRLSAGWVAALSLVSLAGWPWTGPTVLWVLAPVGASAFLKLLKRLGEPVWLKLVPPVGVVVLSAVSAFLFEADKGRTALYMKSWIQGDRLALSGSPREAAAAYERADRERPGDLLHYYQAVRRMMQIEGVDPAQAALVLQHRLPRIIAELEEIVRRDPDGVPPREDLVYYYLLEGSVADAAGQYREMHRLRPRDADITAMLGYLLLREGKADEARLFCRGAAEAKPPSVKAMVNLGVILFSEGRDDEARKLWEDALALKPAQPLARLNIDRLATGTRDRAIDIRYLARPGPGGHLAPAVNNLAAAGEGYSVDERIRLLVEASQLDPRYREAHLNLAKLYRQRNAPGDLERAAWHARQGKRVQDP